MNLKLVRDKMELARLGPGTNKVWAHNFTKNYCNFPYSALAAMRTCHKFLLLRGSHLDFYQYVWLSEWRLEAEAHREILSVDPFVPNGIVVFKILHKRPPPVQGAYFRD